MKTYHYPESFTTETGTIINGLDIAYHYWGELNEAKDNVIWICHALTANSDASDWWPGMVGAGRCFDTGKYFVVCANVFGSCYGTTGPLSVNPDTGRQWLHTFPEITIRDIVRVNDLLREHLGITHIHLITGGSIGGFQAMEWAIMKPKLFSHILLIACSAKASPWVIAFNESQRLALMADSTFAEGFRNRHNGHHTARETDGSEGLRAARSMALISYRTCDAYNITQAETTNDMPRTYRAASYQQHQGDKLVKRFNAYSYYVLTRFIDSHNIFRNRPDIEDLLNAITGRTTVIGITTDILYPVAEQKHLATLFPDAVYKEIYSDFGHDGFLIEKDQLTEIMEHSAFSSKHSASAVSTQQ